MTNKLKTRRYSIPDADDATILSIFDKAAHYAEHKRTVSVMVGNRVLPSVQTLYGLQRRHPEIDWSASRLISRVSGTYGPMQLHFTRTGEGAKSELLLVSPEGAHVNDMVRFVASRPALLELKSETAAGVLTGLEERRIRAARAARAHGLRLRVTVSDARTWQTALQAFLPAKTYIPMGAIAGRLRSVASSPVAEVPQRRHFEWRFVSIAAALVTLVAGVQAVSFFYA